MKSTCNFLYFLLFLSLPIFLCSCQGKVHQNPQKENASVTSAGDLWDFGQIKAGEIYAHNFIFKNETGKTLTISQINTSCGCTASEVKKKVLSSGESTEVEVKFDSTGYSGPVQQHIYVNTDNPDNPIYRFKIKADVI